MTMSEPVSANPYLGLRPYTEAERAYFFGREAERRVIAANLLSARLTVLYGASGVGKSSILLAGVAPYIRALPDMIVVVFRAWKRDDAAANLHALKAAIAHAVTDVSTQSLSLD